MSHEHNLAHVRHSLAHVLLMAVKHHYPHALPTIGPVIDTGFYYDFDFKEGPKPGIDDLAKIEATMEEIRAKDLAFRHEEVTADQARSLFEANAYKIALINDLEKEGKVITIYYTGDTFFDLCVGGHTDSTGSIAQGSFKLDKVAGAYWRGDENNAMLTRIYGLAFDTKEELDAYITQQEEAKKRDHKIIGPALKLFTTSPLIGAGLPLIAPRGMIIRKEIEDYLWNLHKKKGYHRVWTPHIAKIALYETSGHAAKFGDELFRVQGKEDSFIMKPMNCPHHMQIFADNQFSYRDMPVRYFEPATVYRDEKSGQLGGLTRVRAITQDDGHLFCRPDQIGEEIATIVDIIKTFYENMQMIDGYWVRLSLRGDDASKYLGSDEVWATAEAALTRVCEEQNLPFVPAKDEAAFYGPKLDFMFKDAIGREWQLATIQCDFNLPERFDLSYTTSEGTKERPVVIHRAISGSLERFMGVLIEHYSGAFPLWLSPTQISVIPIADTHHDYARTVHQTLVDADIRAEVDTSKEGLGKKIRAAREMKTPYWAVIGDAEVANGTVTLEHRTRGKIGEMKIDDLVHFLAEEIKNKK